MLRMHPDAADHVVHAGVVRADRLRRTRESTRRVWRAAPVAAAICVLVGGISRTVEYKGYRFELNY